MQTVLLWRSEKPSLSRDNVSFAAKVGRMSLTLHTRCADGL